MNRNITLTAAAITLALASIFNAPEASAQSRHLHVQAPIPQNQLRQVATGSYYSPRLKARFVLQYMTIPGHNFWGARIVDMGYDSPLRHINLQVGDVVTRLDGIRISDGRFQKTDYSVGAPVWQIPQLEKHYGQTHVRFIRSGRDHAHQETVDLGPLHCDNHNPDPHDHGGIAP
jgi:hypothetical protein